MSDNGAAASQTTSDRPVVFISYSHEDKKWMVQLERYLRALEKKELIRVWVDTDIEPGTSWRDMIHKGLEEAQAVVMLLSIDFFNSDFITKEEFPMIVERADSKKQLLLTLYVGPIPDAVLHPAIGKMQGINDPATGTLMQLPMYLSEEACNRTASKVSQYFSFKQAILARAKGNATLQMSRDAFKFCDRDNQIVRFDQFLRTRIGEEIPKPMGVFIPGKACEEHVSLLEVLKNNMGNYLFSLPDGDRNALQDVIWVGWPTTPHKEDAKKDLMSRLHSEIQPGWRGDYSPERFCRLQNIQSLPYVLIGHTIHEREWSSTSAEVLKWYLDEFWGAMAGLSGIPRFMIFFIVTLENDTIAKKIRRLLPGGGRNIVPDLNGLSSPKVPILVLPNLEPVPEIKVWEWFNKYNQIDGIKNKRDEIIKELFGTSQLQSMNKVEKSLRSVCLPFT